MGREWRRGVRAVGSLTAASIIGVPCHAPAARNSSGKMDGAAMVQWQYHYRMCVGPQPRARGHGQHDVLRRQLEAYEGGGGERVSVRLVV